MALEPDFQVSSLASPLTPGGYHEYFGESVDLEAMVYLMLVRLAEAFRLTTGKPDASRALSQCSVDR